VLCASIVAIAVVVTVTASDSTTCTLVALGDNVNARRHHRRDIIGWLLWGRPIIGILCCSLGRPWPSSRRRSAEPHHCRLHFVGEVVGLLQHEVAELGDDALDRCTTAIFLLVVFGRAIRRRC
jgi:hypothetical protein